MKRWRLVSAVIAVSCVASGLHAEYKKLTFFGQAEYLTYSNAFGKAEDSFNQAVGEDQASMVGSGSMTSDSKTSGGVGFRIGALATTPLKGLKVGGSFGYILGPSFTGKENFFYNDGWIETVKGEDTSKLFRYMGEAKYSVPLGEKFQARLGFAMGLAALKVTEKGSYDGSGGGFSPASASYKKSISTMKLSWEIGPAVAYVTDQIGVELALTYAQMPTAEDMNTFEKFKWNPIGVRLGVEF